MVILKNTCKLACRVDFKVGGRREYNVRYFEKNWTQLAVTVQFDLRPSTLSTPDWTLSALPSFEFLPIVELDLPPRRRNRSTLGKGRASEPNRAVFNDPIWLQVDFCTSSEYLNLKISDRNLKRILKHSNFSPL